MLGAVQSRNSTGLLPNDRTHVAKGSLSRALAFGTQLGVFGTWQSGTPTSQFGTGPFGFPVFIVPRGTAGRTPGVWDLGLRVSHGTPWLPGRLARGSLLLDVLHIGNPPTTVRLEQQKYRSVSDAGVPSEPNEAYGKPLLFQPPMSARLGFEVRF